MIKGRKAEAGALGLSSALSGCGAAGELLTLDSAVSCVQWEQ